LVEPILYTDGVIILAFDPGLERTGYALFDIQGSKYTLGAHGCITTPKTHTLEARLHQLYEAVEKIIVRYRPKAIAIEKLFFNINKKTVIAVAQGQGTLLALAGKYGVAVTFLTPSEVKLALTGYGNSDKKGVEKMVLMLLGIKVAPKPDDVVDAIACGLAYCTIKKFAHL